MKIRERLRTGDKAILVGVAVIVAYEKLVRDDADLISSRVAEYKVRHPVLTQVVVLVTALHLIERLPPRWDPYHQAVRYFRSASASPKP
jgi:hypothetical protein